MKKPEFRPRGAFITLLFSLLFGSFHASAADSAQLISVSIPTGTSVLPRMMFTQTWSLKNTGTTTWSPFQQGYTLNLVGTDTLGAVPLYTNTVSDWYMTCATIDSGKPVVAGALAVFGMSFIAPEAAGTYSDTFQMVNASGVAFGPEVAVQIVVPRAGSTNQYDRARAISYANNYAGFVCSDGYFWTNGSDYYDFGALAPVPTAELGDDCAHYISSCIGRQASLRGGGLLIPSRVPPTYGEPGVARLVNTCLIAPGYATEVFSLTDLSPGDIIAWNWEGDTNIADLDHATLYLGHGLLASHSTSCLDVAPAFFQDSLPDWRWHLIHILDAPALTATKTGSNLVLSWGTNWTGYVLYTAPSTGTAWTKVATTPVRSGVLNKVSSSLPSGAAFYRLTLPGP